ncbi:MAG: hypothetical protein ABW003_21330, partial [Microvirga sp.]
MSLDLPPDEPVQDHPGGVVGHHERLQHQHRASACGRVRRERLGGGLFFSGAIRRDLRECTGIGSSKDRPPPALAPEITTLREVRAAFLRCSSIRPPGSVREAKPSIARASPPEGERVQPALNRDVRT